MCIRDSWSILPATDGIITNLEIKEDMNKLAPGKIYETVWGIEIHED